MATKNNYKSLSEIYDTIIINGKSIALGSLNFDSESQANDNNQRESIKAYCETLAKKLNSDCDFSINKLKAECEPLYIEVIRSVSNNVNDKFLPRLEFKQGLLSIGGRFNRKMATFRNTTVTTTKLITMFFRIKIAYDTRCKAEALQPSPTTTTAETK